jgi:PTS system cellobiose-specific IIC component
MSRSSVASRPSSADSNLDHLVPAGDGFVARFERAVAPFAKRFAEAPPVAALRESLPIAFAVLVVALAALVALQPFTGWAQIPRRLSAAIPAGFACASVAMVLVLMTRLAIRLQYPVALTVPAALAAFALALPRAALRSPAAFSKTLGASGLFTAIVVSLAVAAGIGASRRRFGRRIGTLAGALGVVAAAALLAALGFSLADALATLLSPLATLGDSFVALLVITAIEAALFLVGIHGPALLAALVLPLYTELQFQNTSAAHAHEPIPHVVVVSTFLLVFPGGAGATLPLVLLLLRSRVARLKKFALATLLPSLFNVNEPVIFGLPLAYNPTLAVPFVVAPVVLACTTYAALALGFVERPIYYIPSTLPVFVNVFLATFDWRACALMAVNVAIAGAIWFPFVRMYERVEAVRP